MIHLSRIGWLAALATVAVAAESQAGFVINAGPVTVRIGPNVGVEVRPVMNLEVRPGQRMPARTLQPQANPNPVQTPPGVEIAPPAPPVPLPGAKAQKETVPSIQEFAASFRATAGTHDVVVMHPFTGQPVQVSFKLPAGTPNVHIKGAIRRCIEFDYDDTDVEIWFYKDGRVQVKY